MSNTQQNHEIKDICDSKFKKIADETLYIQECLETSAKQFLELSKPIQKKYIESLLILAEMGNKKAKAIKDFFEKIQQID